MIKRYVKIAVSAWVFAGLTTAAAFRRLSGLEARPCLTILYYHALPKAWVPGFERQMAMLARWARVVAADWEGDGIDQSVADHRYTVAITFDDAFESVLDNAVPVLAAHGFHCTIFAPSGCFGQSPSWAMETEEDSTERVADAERLSRLPGDLVTIGSHTVTHPRLTALSNETARRELIQSMQDLTVLTGTSVRLLAFPYGDHDDAVVELCRSSGYRHVYTIRPTPVQLGSDEFARGRVAVGPSDGPLEFFLKLTGSYRWLPVASAIKSKRLASRHAKLLGGRPDA
jgi:peptidoglycan/xylan/chitin deacetylase (PgdA/CDA1 family)